MTELSLLSDKELLDRVPRLVLAERACAADVILHLMEIDRRRVYLDAACRSLTCYCLERLGFSEDESGKRVRVARIARRVPRVIEELLAQRFPKPDVPARICPEPRQQPLPTEPLPTAPLPTAPPPTSSAPASAHRTQPSRIAPLSESRWSVQLSIGAQLKAKIDEAARLLSHAVPGGHLEALIERAFDALLAEEAKRRFGANKPRKRRPLKPGSRHIPVEIVRAVSERDGGRCTFVDEHGNRCSAREHLTLEHRHPYAKGGGATAENLCLLCSAHNLHAARRAFGEEHIEQRILEAECRRAHAALCNMGFREGEVRKALATARQTT